MSVHYCSQVWSKQLIVEKLGDEVLLEWATMQNPLEIGTAYLSEDGERLDIRAGILNEMRLGAVLRKGKLTPIGVRRPTTSRLPMRDTCLTSVGEHATQTQQGYLICRCQAPQMHDNELF